MTAVDPPRVRDRREQVAGRLARAPGVLLALDFDGTLAPIVDRPDGATMDAAARDSLERLAGATTVRPAVVSGRELDDLRDRVAVDGVDYAGNHGLELFVDGERTVPGRATQWREAVDAACGALEDRLADVEGCEIEHKGLTATVHGRRVPEDRRAGVEGIVRDAVATVHDDLEVTAGKAVWEIRPPVEWDKGRAVADLADRVPAEWLAVYVGDDVTDEDAFEALAALDRATLAILVGDRTDTAADYRLADQSAVADFLALVAEHHDPPGP